MNAPRLATAAAALALFLAGCNSGSSTSAGFVASATPPAPGLVKLVESSRSGQRVSVDAIVYGPEPGLDLFEFRFGVHIGNAGLVHFVPQQSYTQTALVAGAGQTIAADVDGSDPSLVRVDVAKQGGGAGNGIAGATAIVIRLTFEVQGSGSTTLTLAGDGNGNPQALDRNDAPIGAVHFDPASASVRGVSSGGGGY